MSTKIQYVKSGTTFSCDSTVLPRPTVQAEYPLPAFNQLSNSYLTLSLPTISSTGLPSVQVNSALTLPGPAGSWTLNYISYQGSMPVNPVWQTITIPGLTVNSLIPNVIPSGTFTAYLSQTVGTQTLNYAQANNNTGTCIVYPPWRRSVTVAGRFGSSPASGFSTADPFFARKAIGNRVDQRPLGTGTSDHYQRGNS